LIFKTSDKVHRSFRNLIFKNAIHLIYLPDPNEYRFVVSLLFNVKLCRVENLGSCHKRQKPQAPTPQAPIRNWQTRKVANAKGLNRNTNLTLPNPT